MEHPGSKRRYTFSPSSRALSAKEIKVEPVHAWSRKQHQFRERSGSIPDESFFRQPNLPEDRDPQDYLMLEAPPPGFLQGQGVRRKGKSWKDILKLKRKRATKLQSPPQPQPEKASRESDVYRPRVGGYCIRVVVTEINPQAYYKTLEVTDRTTAFEVIVKLIQKYAVNEEDRDPNEFYLMEVKEGSQGSYSRVLGNSDQLYELQCRWDESEDCYFALYRAKLPASTGDTEPEVEDKFEQPEISNFRAMIISPSQDSFFDGFPDSHDGFFASPSSPLPPPVSTQSPTMPTSQSSLTYHDISSCLQVSKLIVSPSDNKESDTVICNSKSKLLPLPLKPPVKPVPRYTAFSNPNIETIIESEGEVEKVTLDNEMRRFSDSELKQTQRQLMQKSVHTGMQEIMAKVISETKQNTPNRKRVHERSQTSPSRLLTVSASLPLSPLQQDLTIRNLLCSPLAPVQVNKKNIPDFVFTPGPEDEMSGSEGEFQGSELSEPMRTGGSIERNFDFIGALDFNGSLAEENEMEEEKEMERQWEGQVFEGGSGDLRSEVARESGKASKILKRLVDDVEKEEGEEFEDVEEEENNEEEGEDEENENEEDEYEEKDEENHEVEDKEDQEEEEVEDEEEEEEVKDEEEEEDNEEVEGKEGCIDCFDDANDNQQKCSEEDKNEVSIEFDDGICGDEVENVNEGNKSVILYYSQRKELEPSAHLSELSQTPIIVQKVLDLSLTSICAVATRFMETNLVVAFQHSATSEFEWCIRQEADETLKSVLSLPNFDTQANLRNHTTNNNLPSESISSSMSNESLTGNACPHFRRSKTHQSLFSSVTKANRPHSIHLTNTSSESKIDFTKDEIFRRAALQGMVKKPKSKEWPPPATDRSPGEKKVKLPLKDIVTDLDVVSVGERKQRRPIRRYSLLEIKNGNQPYVRLKERKAILDGSPPSRRFKTRQKERPKSFNFWEDGEGSPRPYSAPATCKKSNYQSES